ncbi:MAG: hypothetical protein Q4D14_02410 [Bacteroidales bacterium]|nr:hypothetical protein [Bacteroidales bacterium]
MAGLQPIRLYEQQHLEDKDWDYISSLSLPLAGCNQGVDSPFLGINAEGWSSYLVGAAWLKQGHRPLVVLPKFPKIDYLKILADVLSDDLAPEYFADAYRINFDAPSIQEEALNSVLTPLMVVHFLSSVKRLLKHGLKRSYIIREENLNAKVKGHILSLRNLQKNVIRGHAEDVLCRYQEYSLDYAENRLIKRAMLAARSMLMSLHSSNNTLLFKLQQMLVAFDGVSSDITPSSVKNIKKDKLHGEYPETIVLAKFILRRTDYSISEGSNQTLASVPEFSIDMSRIFEFHVLSLLKKQFKEGSVLFQVPLGFMGRCDYIVTSQNLIIDAKYKAWYNNPLTKLEDLRADIREIAGYARSQKVQKLMGTSTEQQPKCLIVYPNGNYTNKEEVFADDLLQNADSFEGLSEFYRIGVSLPTYAI